MTLLRVLSIFMALILFTGFVSESVANERARPNSADTRQDLLRLHNKMRLANSKKPLRHNAKLSAAAQSYAEYLAKSGKFSHEAKGTVSSRVKKTGYDMKAVGENIAYGQESASKVVNGWMDSKGHKENMMNKRFTEVGFGIARDKNGRLVWVTDFGDR